MNLNWVFKSHFVKEIFNLRNKMSIRNKAFGLYISYKHDNTYEITININKVLGKNTKSFPDTVLRVFFLTFIKFPTLFKPNFLNDFSLLETRFSDYVNW